MTKTFWYPALNRWHDQTGISHTVKINKNRIAQTTCGTRVYSLGGGYEEPITQACSKCLAREKRGTV